jgi:hypothetical protein
MPEKRRTTLSDTPFERRVVEEAGRRELDLLLYDLQDSLADMPAPKGWHRRRGPGRPPKRKTGGQEKYTWQNMMFVHVLKAYLELTTREMSSFLRASPELCRRIGLSQAPSHTSIARAIHRFPEAWLMKLNRRLLSDVKKRGPDGRVIEPPVWTPRASRSKVRGAGKRSASTNARSAVTIEN